MRDEVIPYRNKLDEIEDKDNLIVIPSLLYVPMFEHSSLVVGAQDISAIIDQTVTGEVTGEQLAKAGVKYVLVGHSERREFKHEINIDFINKINSANENGIKTIYCIGETAKEKENGETYQVLEQQISEVLNNVDLKNLIVAYEPVWAIGSGLVPSVLDIKDTILFIKDLIEENYGVKMNVLYGGSVNTGNIEEINQIKELDGFLVGSASLDAEKVTEMLEIIAE